MLSRSNIDVLPVVKAFKTAKIPFALLVPTDTGLPKSIMDATIPLREYLKEYGIHDYEDQDQGQEAKVILPTLVYSGGIVRETTTSLYRPNTKSGDPRIWVSRLGQDADPFDLLAFTHNGSHLVVINCTRTPEISREGRLASQLLIRLSLIALGPSVVAEELLGKLRDISKRGFIPTLRPGDTGIGYTLETLLGIQANSRRSPDYKGIELKSKRLSRGSSTKSTLFSKVPKWSISRLKSSTDILFERGQFNQEKQRLQLFHTISASAPNSYGLQLEVPSDEVHLHQIHVEEDIATKDVSWVMADLKRDLEKKHRETFWVQAKTQGSSGSSSEMYWYQRVKHTGNIDRTALPTLLQLGVVTVDYLIYQIGERQAKDKGYLFKIKPADLDLLFTSVDHYDLSN